MKLKLIIFSTISFIAIGTAYAQTVPQPAVTAPVEDVSTSASQAQSVPATETATPPPVSAPPEIVPIEIRILQKVREQLKEKFRSDIYTPANIPSLFFSPTQQSLLNSARQGMTNSLADGSLEGLENSEVGGEGTLTSVPSITSIFLSGIVYNAKDNWTIWLNGARVTPQNIPKEIIDINVSQEFIELKWFDAATNQIFPVRLRPNQKFDFEKKIFLPGQ
jgi:hypothetical protein